MSLEHLVVPESEKVLKTLQTKNTQPTTVGMGGSLFKDSGGTERSPNSKNWENLSNKTDKAVLAYNPKYKINILRPY